MKATSVRAKANIAYLLYLPVIIDQFSFLLPLSDALVLDGYGFLITALSEGLDIRLNSIVKSIEQQGVIGQTIGNMKKS